VLSFFGGIMIHITQTTNKNTLTVTVSGRIDTQTAPELEQSLHLDDVDTLIFDLKDTEYVSSAGLRVFLEALKVIETNRGDMKIINIQPMVKQVFCEVGFDKIIDLS